MERRCGHNPNTDTVGQWHMEDESQRFRRLMAGLRTGEPWAAEELCRSYGPALRLVVRRRLRPELRSHFDSLDFVQDLWASFLTIPQDRYTFETPGSLRQFLTQVVLNKVVEAHRRRFETQKNDISREVSLHKQSDRVDRIELVSREPTPSWFAIATEEWERLLQRFPTGQRTVLMRLREGYTYDDIAQMTGISRSSIKRIVRRLKEITGL